MADPAAVPHTEDVALSHHPSIEPSAQLEAEMSGLRAQLTSLRTDSVDIATDLLSILAPLPADVSQRTNPVSSIETVEVVAVVRSPIEIAPS